MTLVARAVSQFSPRPKEPPVIADTVRLQPIAAEPAQAPRVAIIIAGRNNAEFLREAIESAISQTIPCEVVYADDCSFDDSISIARSYEPRGLKVLPSPLHRGVCEARNRGSAATFSPYLMNLDSDDVLTPDYAEKSLAAMRYDTPFAYSLSKLFGAASGLCPCPEWDRADIWKTNHVNTSALYARWAFDLAGGWVDTKTAWDWDLALRASKFGTPRKSGAILLYRRHDANWSHQNDFVSRAQNIRLRNSLLSIAATITGSDPTKFRNWLSTVVQAARQIDVRRELILIDNSPGLLIETEVAKYAENFEFVRILKAGDEPRLRSECAGNLVWVAEYGLIPHAQDCRNAITTLSEGKFPPDVFETDSEVVIERRIRT